MNTSQADIHSQFTSGKTNTPSMLSGISEKVSSIIIETHHRVCEVIKSFEQELEAERERYRKLTQELEAERRKTQDLCKQLWKCQNNPCGFGEPSGVKYDWTSTCSTNCHWGAGTTRWIPPAENTSVKQPSKPKPQSKYISDEQYAKQLEDELMPYHRK